MSMHSISKKSPWYNSGTKFTYCTCQIPSKCIISAKLEPLKFRTYLLNLSFSRSFQLLKINSVESYDFFLARTYRARIQLIFTNTRGIQYSPYISHCVSPYRVPNLTLGTKYKYPMNIKNGILNVPKHGNKLDLIHFVTISTFPGYACETTAIGRRQPNRINSDENFFNSSLARCEPVRKRYVPYSPDA